MGAAAAFSFYPGKNLGACGEAGAITTDDEQIARRCRMLRDHGQSKKYFHDIEGYNGRLDAIQAGLLRVKLRAPREVERAAPRGGAALRRAVRRRGADRRSRRTCRRGRAPSITSTSSRGRRPRDRCSRPDGRRHRHRHPLSRCRCTCPRPTTTLGFRSGDFPVAERAAAEVLSLPMFPRLSARAAARGSLAAVAPDGGAVASSVGDTQQAFGIARSDTARSRVPRSLEPSANWSKH